MVEPDARHRKPPPRLPMTLTSALEHVAGMIDRLDSALAFHPLLGAVLGVRARLDRGVSGPPLRAALALYGQRRRVTALPCRLSTGAAALDAELPWRMTNGRTPAADGRASWRSFVVP